MNLLEVKNLSVHYKNYEENRKNRAHAIVENVNSHHFLSHEEQAVDQISFTMQYGEILGIVGESGSGKSTLARTIAGLLPHSAQISYDSYQIHAEQKQIAIVFQEPKSYLNPSQRIGRQLMETIQIHTSEKMSYAKRKERAKQLLEQAGLQQPEEWMKRYPHELSGGQCQRVALAIAFACEPKLLIADEPTSALDVTVQRQILSRMKQMSQENGTAILLISHDFGVISMLSEQVLIMQRGKIIETGTVEEIFYEPRHPYTKRLIENAKRKSKLFERGEMDAPPLLDIRHLWKIYGNKQSLFLKNNSVRSALKDISLQIRSGQIYGLLGESGCGKTTLAKLITGLEQPSSGELHFCGYALMSQIEKRTTEQIQGIQMVFQDTKSSLDPQYTVEKILREVFVREKYLVQNKSERGKIIGEDKEISKRISEILQKVGLSEYDRWKYPSEFSGGQQQRIGIARALLADPQLLILDEAVSALDVTVQEEILQLLSTVQKEKKLTYLFISHDLQVIRRMCDVVAVMYAGQIVETGNTEKIYKEPWHPYTKLLLNSILDTEPKLVRKKLAGGIERWTEQRRTNGCPFVSRCRYAMECCKREQPELYQFGEHCVACFLYSEKHAGKRSKGYQMGVQI